MKHRPHPNARLVRAPLAALSLALGSWLLISPAASAQAANQTPTTGSAAKKRPARAIFIKSPSSESPAARQKRLKRECKGRPNAGACLGLTR
ncbi:MAG TPA: hypothetical protein VIN35_14435 [Hydrogenophaga sp.]